MAFLRRVAPPRLTPKRLIAINPCPKMQRRPQPCAEPNMYAARHGRILRLAAIRCPALTSEKKTRHGGANPVATRPAFWQRRALTVTLIKGGSALSARRTAHTRFCFRWSLRYFGPVRGSSRTSPSRGATRFASRLQFLDAPPLRPPWEKIQTRRGRRLH